MTMYNYSNRPDLEFRYKIVEIFFEFRRYNGWSIKNAANRLMMDSSYLANVENQKKPPSKRLIEKMVNLILN